ncbi:unnamed protein product [Cuscuta europaea]|uniref:RRM domain-containing protein n=1 Tax=Cuscuta europaea TaxID=41803 RepID=A0A9P0ZA62_CUSEU|nr:unnamed protein product [Cuscuta europaea]
MSPGGYTAEVTSLSPIATEKHINDFFALCGKIDHVEIVRAGEHGGTAYVTFRSSHALETAVLLSKLRYSSTQTLCHNHTQEVRLPPTTQQPKSDTQLQGEGATCATTSPATSTHAPTRDIYWPWRFPIENRCPAPLLFVGRPGKRARRTQPVGRTSLFAHLGCGYLCLHSDKLQSISKTCLVSSSSKWIIDSGASNHMTGSLNEADFW